MDDTIYIFMGPRQETLMLLDRALWLHLKNMETNLRTWKRLVLLSSIVKTLTISHFEVCDSCLCLMFHFIFVLMLLWVTWESRLKIFVGEHCMSGFAIGETCIPHFRLHFSLWFCNIIGDWIQGGIKNLNFLGLWGPKIN